MRWKFCIQFGQAARVRRDAHCDGVYGRVPKRDSYLSALIRRLAARRGSKRATMGVGHAILVIGLPPSETQGEIHRTRRQLLRFQER